MPNINTKFVAIHSMWIYINTCGVMCVGLVAKCTDLNVFMSFVYMRLIYIYISVALLRLYTLELIRRLPRENGAHKYARMPVRGGQKSYMYHPNFQKYRMPNIPKIFTTPLSYFNHLTARTSSVSRWAPIF